MLGACAVSSPQPPPLPLARVAVRTAYGGRPVAPLFINGDGPFDFIVDTASTRSAVFANLAARLGVAPIPGRRARVFSFAAMREQPIAGVASVVIEGLDLGLGEALLFEDWEGQEATPQGILGLDVLSAYILDLDVAAGFLSLYDAMASPRAIRPGASTANMRRDGFGVSRDGLYLLDASVAGRGFPMLLDSGASVSLGSLPLIDTIPTLPRPSRNQRSTSIADANDLEAETYLLRTPILRTTDIIWRDLRFYVSDAAIFRDLNMADRPLAILGFDQMRHRPLVFDFVRGALYADAPSAQPPDTEKAPAATG